MAKRIPKKDLRLTIPELVEKYPVGQIIAAVKKCAAGNREAGRPKRYQGNIIAIWACIEFRLKHGEATSKEEAFKGLADDLRQWIADWHPTEDAISGWYYQAAKLFEREPKKKEEAACCKYRDRKTRHADPPVVRPTEGWPASQREDRHVGWGRRGINSSLIILPNFFKARTQVALDSA